MTPNIAVIRFDNPYARRFRLWVPLFLLWIPFILVLPFLLLVLLVVCLGCKIDFFHTLRVAWGILCALPGTHVRVQAQANDIQIELR
jgi:hypothetical protein